MQARIQLGGPGSRGVDGALHLLRREAVGPPDVDAVPGRDRTNRVLRLPRVTDLADSNDIERKTERGRHLGGNDDTATHKTHDDGISPALGLEGAGKEPARMAPVREHCSTEDPGHELRHIPQSLELPLGSEALEPSLLAPLDAIAGDPEAT